MLLINCPYCGERPEIEFRNGGEAHIARPPVTASEEEWAAFLFLRDNPKGSLRERWFHSHGCQTWFNAVRDTFTDTLHATYKVGEAKPALPQAATPEVKA
jgi:sarcosine oxidase, subunit delta